MWAAAVGLAAYSFGEAASRLAGAVGWVFLGVAVVGLVAGGAFLRKHEQRLEDEAERALPGPLDDADCSRRGEYGPGRGPATQSPSGTSSPRPGRWPPDSKRARASSSSLSESQARVQLSSGATW